MVTWPGFRGKDEYPRSAELGLGEPGWFCDAKGSSNPRASAEIDGEFVYY
jgi:hypothetical protein